jgi:hypothetical protein
MLERPRGVWIVSWSAVWLGALAGLVVAVLFGLIGVAIGAHAAVAEGVPLDMSAITFLGLVWAVAAAFFANVIGGWVAASMVDDITAESGALHGAAAFLVAAALLFLLATLGAGAGGWYAGLGPAAIDPAAAEDSARAARDSALAAAVALLIGLIGSVLGGWFGSGEPMDWATARRRRRSEARRRAE